MIWGIDLDCEGIYYADFGKIVAKRLVSWIFEGAKVFWPN